MLVPITRAKFEELVPALATAAQYRYCWGSLTDFLRRLLFSLVGVLAAVAIEVLLGEGFDAFVFVFGAIASIYWLLVPIYFSRQKNNELRRYSYGGFWQGEVLDKYVTEEVVGTQEKADRTGRLVVVEDREAKLNLEIGDRSGFETRIQIPAQRSHRVIRRGDIVEMVVASNRSDLSRIGMISDIYLPDHKLWISQYPYLRRDLFVEVSRQIQQRWYADRDRR